MLHTTFIHALAKGLALVTLCLLGLTSTAKVGLDAYEIYLNDQLILKQYVNQPLDLRKLQLEKADVNDQLRIYYTHCHIDGAGTGRSIAVKDQKGHVLRQWEFMDVADSRTSAVMVIPVKELLQLEKSHAHHELTLHYTAKELFEGETFLASFRLD
jgi:hypothetical protein